MEDAVRREIALFRYALVRQAADPALTGTERGRLVRDLAGRDHVGPDTADGWPVPLLMSGSGPTARAGLTR
jgi:hypothetical protein